MIDYSAVNLKHFAAAWVGNKNRYEGVNIPANPENNLNEIASEIMIGSLLKPFEKTEEFFYFFHTDDVSQNLVYQRIYSIFESPERIGNKAAELAGMLYEHMESTRLQGGEFFVVYLEDVYLNGEPTNAIALWKIQDKQVFLKPDRSNQRIGLSVLDGIHTGGKVETAALIFNLDEAEGYRICAIDTVSKKDERSFWKDEFLRIRPIEDNYFNTRHTIGLTTEFINQKAPFKFGLTRLDTIDLINRSGDYFKNNEEFDVNDFAGTVFATDDQREAFKEFSDEYVRAYAVPLEDQFDISRQAVKKEQKVFKSVIKLDKNFHLYVHGRRDLIERGFDEEKGKKYYKVFFETEE